MKSQPILKPPRKSMSIMSENQSSKLKESEYFEPNMPEILTNTDYIRRLNLNMLGRLAMKKCNYFDYKHLTEWNKS